MRLLFIYSLLIYSLSFAENRFNYQKMAQDKRWLRLLHYKGGKSTIINRDFFISPFGDENPQEELFQTISSFKRGELVCKYPARYLFLAKRLNISEDALLKCEKLQKWTVLKNSKDISIVFVSGFLGNPASAFGHSFLKLNSSSQTTNLFDMTISYGAKLPKKYTIFSYMYNGITGGYKASYSDKYYYMDDMVYSNSEFREMWEYRLKLNEYQKRLLLYHLWELRGVEFRYYFFNQNCGYKLAELLDILYDKPILKSAKIWYAPIETFFNIEELSLVEEIIYHPSQQQKVYALYNSLSPLERRVVDMMVEDELFKISPKFDNLSPNSKSKIMDFIMDFRKYSKKEINPKTLLYRMELPTSNYIKTEPKYKQPVTAGNKMSHLNMGLHMGHHLELGFAGFEIDKVGFNSLNGDMLSIVNLQLWVERSKLKLKNLDFVKIRRLKTSQLPFDRGLSWELNVGVENIPKEDYTLEGGAGYSWEIFDNFKTYSLLKTSFHSTDKHIRFAPTVGVYGNLNRMRVNFEYGKIFDGIMRQQTDSYSLDVEYRYRMQESLYIRSELELDHTTSVGVKWFF